MRAAGCSVLIGLLAAAPAHAQRSAPALELVEPAPGCPEKVPTLESLLAYCEPLDQAQCKAEKRCRWLGAARTADGIVVPASCDARPGAYLAERAPDPGLRAPGIPELEDILDDPDVQSPAERQAAKLAASAYDAAAGKQYDRALALYGQSIKADPERGAPHVWRALVHEHRNRPAEALRDYCDGLTKGASWQPQDLAEERIAVLTGAEADRTPPPQFMNSGVLRARKGRPAVAPLRIETPGFADYLVKLINVADESEEMLIYVRSGSSYEAPVPLGTYRIRVASGTAWYGEPLLFGDSTSTFRLEQLRSDRTGASTDEFRFLRHGNQLLGFTLRFRQSADGNLDSAPIDSQEF